MITAEDTAVRNARRRPRMPLDPQFRAILDTLESSGLLPLIRGDAAQARARYPAMTSASITENDEGYLVVRQCAGLQAGGGGGRT